MTSIVVDIGASKVAIGSADGHVKPFTSGAPKDYLALLHLIESEIECNTSLNRLASIAVAAPGQVSRTGDVKMALYSCVRNQNLKRDLVGRLGRPVVVENDAKAQAIGLGKMAAPGTVYLTIGTAIGGAIIDDRGAIWRGVRNFAGELGHLGGFSGKTCPCGQIGCLDTLSSGWSIADDLGPKWYLKGSELYRSRLQEAGNAVGDAINRLSTLLDPSAFIICGRIVAYSDFWDSCLLSSASGSATISRIDDQWPLTVAWSNTLRKA